MNSTKDKIFKALTALFVGALCSIALLAIIRKREGKKITFKKLFSMHTVATLSRVYDIIISGVPHKDSHVITNVIDALQAAKELYEEMFQIKRTDKFLKFIEEEGFTISDNAYLVPLIWNTRLKEKVEVRRGAYELAENLHVTEWKFPDGDRIYISELVQEEATRKGHHHPVVSHDEPKRIRNDEGSEIIALSPGFNLQAKLDLLWTYYQDGIYIHSRDAYEAANFDAHSDNLVIEDYNHPPYKFYGKLGESIDKFAETLLKFKEAGIQRTYLFVGNPGTGKSSYAYEVSKRFSNKFIKISADIFKNFSRNELDFIFKCLKPDSVIIDDFDRIYDDVSDADTLFFFESLKTNYGNVTVYCTVNNMQKLGFAIIRPGRVDLIKVFKLPDAKDRRKILDSFIEDMELPQNPTEQEMNKLVEVTEYFSPAFLKEYCLTLKYEPDFPSLIRRILMTKQFVYKEDFTGEEDESITDSMEELEESTEEKEETSRDTTEDNLCSECEEPLTNAEELAIKLCEFCLSADDNNDE